MVKLSKDFHDYEFFCPCGKCEAKRQIIVRISPILVAKLQQLRDRVGEPIYITSGVRCKAYNKKIGGHSKSAHLPYYILINKKKKLVGCMAADIQVKNMSSVELAMIASRIADIRIGIYERHIHIDIVPANPSKYWIVKKYGQKPIYSKREKSLAKFLKDNL